MKIERIVRRQYRSLWTAQTPSALAAWNAQVKRTRAPALAAALRDRAVFPRFAASYERLRRLPRRTRRMLQRTMAVSLAGAALLLALGQNPGLAATIPVDGTTCTLIDALTAANTDTATGDCPAGSGADVIELAPGSLHTLTSVNNSTYGATGLPVITSEITIEGQGATLQRDSTAPDFRLLAVGSGATLTLKETTVTGGRFDSTVSTQRGAGLCAKHATLRVIGSTISGNASGWPGGGLYAKGGVTDILDSTISGNNNGGLMMEDGVVTITNSVISGNTGNGVSHSASGMSSTLVITKSVISGNEGVGVGAASDEYYPMSVSITDSTISGNESGRNGGGVWLYADTTVTNSTISGNTAQQYGGGMYLSGGTVTLVNTTVSGNHAGRNGGGVAISHYAPTVIRFDKSTITGNTAEKGGGVDPGTGEVFLSHTLVSGNTAVEGPEIMGDVAADAHNLFGVNGEAGVVGFAPGPTDVVPAPGVQLSDILDPVLADTGGPTQTHVLVPGSPALDVIPTDDPGCLGTTDQRGVPRPQGAGCDIGAVELEADQTTLLSTQDSFLQPQRQSVNEGAHPFLDLEGKNRLVVGVDLAGVDPGRVARASLVLTLDAAAPPEGLGANGALVGVHRLLAPWEEGNQVSSGVPREEKQRGSGPGVTWLCAVDADISNRDRECADSWEGGAFAATRSDLVRHLNGMTGEVSFDVTADVQNGADSWLLQKRGGGEGRLRYYATEHPDISLDPTLAPRLVIALQ